MKLIADRVPQGFVLNVKSQALLRKYFSVSAIEVEALARRNWGEISAKKILFRFADENHGYIRKRTFPSVCINH